MYLLFRYVTTFNYFFFKNYLKTSRKVQLEQKYLRKYKQMLKSI